VRGPAKTVHQFCQEEWESSTLLLDSRFEFFAVFSAGGFQARS
jgi:hypothetical protein